MLHAGTPRREAVATVALAAALIASACAERLPAGPRPTGVEPRAGAPGTAVTISGEFYLDVKVSFTGDESHVSDTFTATLGGVALGDVRYLDAATLEGTIPSTLAPGSYTLVVVDPAGREGTLESAFTVDLAAQPVLSIEDAPGGAGTPVGDVAMPAGTQLALHAVARDGAGGFVADVDATWFLTGAAGTISPASGTQTIFTATTPMQTATVRADHATYGVDDTGTITVTSCTSPTDCVSACFSQATCTAGVCDPGPADKDSDGDTFIDASCPGGTDCDDDPGACGASCFPGASEACDGRDNDCAAGTPDGADEPGFGLACDGADTDACLDGTGICDGVAIVCDDPIGSSVEGPTGDPSCANGVDDDCDGATDGADADCAVATPGTPPLVTMFVTPPSGTTATSFLGDATGTVDLEGGPLTFDWDWDGDGVFDATGPTPTHGYATTGERLVSVRVTDASGLAAWESFTVIVTDVSLVGTVTVAADENDGTTTPGPDFSLREAILWANATAGHQVIVVPPGTVTPLGSALPQISDAAGVTIVGDGAIVDGTALGGMANCMTITGSGTIVLGLEIRNCPNIAITITGGAGSRIERCHLHHNEYGVRAASPDNMIGPDNRILDNSYEGVLLNAPTRVFENRFTGSSDGHVFSTALGDGSVVIGNTFTDGVYGVGINNFASSLIVHHNTFAYLDTSAVSVVGSGNGIDFRNNVVAFNGGVGLNGGDAAFTFNDHNLFFANALGDCGCTLPAGTLTADPQFLDGPGRDLRFFATSPLLDAGAPLGRDRNGAAPGTFNGAAEDLGAWESPY